MMHRTSGVQAEASERRSQAENHTEAVFRLRVNLALEVRTVPNSDSVSELWKSRCLDGKIAINPRHDDFPAILAEAIDVLFTRELDFPAACAVLGCTSSQLVKLLEHEPRALAHVNQLRQKAGLRPLR